MLKRTPILHKFKKCKSCKKQCVIFSHGNCEQCARPTYGYISRSNLNALKKIRKPTGELNLFKQLWDKLPHKCVVCGKDIVEFSHNNFAHLLSKGAYPAMRLLDINIKIMCHNNQGTGCHNKFDTKAKSDLLKNDGRWLAVFGMVDLLKHWFYREYNVWKFKQDFPNRFAETANQDQLV